MVALTSVVELLNLLQLSLNVGVAGAAIIQESMDIFEAAFIKQKRDLTALELVKIRMNNKRIRDAFLALEGDLKL